MPKSTPSPRLRKSTGKRLRFEVFKRDFFTCQYCGSQPPDVVLVVDHITPVVAGGETAIDNLITACEACNQGKADKPLTTRQVRPDADLLYLETQQEIAELRRFQEAKAERDDAVRETLDFIIDTWFTFTGWKYVTESLQRTFHSLLLEHDPYVVDDAVRVTANAIKNGRVGDQQARFIPYLYGVIRRMEEGR